jgi:hypothetical protein
MAGKLRQRKVGYKKAERLPRKGSLNTLELCALLRLLAPRVAISVKPEVVERRLVDLSLNLTRERKDLVRNVLEELPKKDQYILRAVFLEDADKAEVCKRFDVNRDYLRVLIHRAKMRFRSALDEGAELGGLKRSAIKASEDESSVFAQAVGVIGDKTAAMRWMGTPVRALDYATPVSLLGTREGRQAVITVLGRLEHGVL